MNDKPKGRLIPKQKLEIVNAELDVPYSQGTKFLDRVQAVNLSLADGDPLAGKPLRMTIFNQSVKTFVRGKTHVVADVEERDRPDSEYGPDRTIVQAYDEEGKPVSTKQGGGGGGYQRRSLEDDLALEAFKRVSIEGQTAVAQVGAALISPWAFDKAGITEEDWKRIVGKYWKAVEKGLDNYLAAPKPAAPAPAARQTPQGQRQPTEKPDQVSSDQASAEASFKNLGELLTAAAKLKPPVTRAEILGACHATEPSQLDLKEAWKKAQAISAGKADSEKARSPDPNDPDGLFK